MQGKYSGLESSPLAEAGANWSGMFGTKRDAAFLEGSQPERS